MRWMVVLVAACSGNGHSPNTTTDGGGDAPAADANNADAAPCSGPDQDGDGICDALDDCPTVFDPAQADLDGDGVGFVCDPVESIVVPGQPVLNPNYFTQIFSHGTTFATVLDYFCTSNTDPTSCAREVIVVGPRIVVAAHSDAPPPDAPWVAPSIGPFVLTTDDQLYLSRNVDGNTTGEFGRVDLATAAYTPTYTQAFVSSTLLSDGLAAAIELSDNSTFELVAPSAGQLAHVATLPPGNIEISASFGSPPTFVLGNGDAATSQLATFVPGTSTFTQVAGGFDEIAQIDGGDLAQHAFCARAGNTTTYFGFGSTGTTMLPLPYANCFSGATDSTNDILFLANTTGVGSSTYQALYIQNQQLHMVGTSTGGTWSFLPGTVPVVTLKHPVGMAYDYTLDSWAITPSGPVVIETGYVDAVVSASGNTVNVVGFQPGSIGTAGYVPIDLARYRIATGVQQVVVASQPVDSQELAVITTAEGGAIIGADGFGWLVGSQATTSVNVNISYPSGGVRGSATVFSAPSDVGHPAGGNGSALYAYDEPGGVPRLTQLLATVDGFYLVDPPGGPPSAWFETSTMLATVAQVNGTPTLTGMFAQTGQVETLGWTTSGALAVEATVGGSSALVALGTTATVVARGSQLNVVTDRPVVLGATVVGWYGKDPAGIGFACLASHPDHCWGIDPVLAFAVSAANDSFGMLGATPVAQGTKIEILRTMGQGDRPQPL